MQYNILLVEDDPSIGEMVVKYLMKEGFQIDHASDGEEAGSMFQERTYDIILLDLMLPNSNGMDILQIIRERSTTPVIIISAKDSDVDKALGLGFGADDYIAKPFSLIELTARVKSAIRRANQYSLQTTNEDSTLLKADEITLDPENIRAFKKDNEIKLTAKEWKILKLFFLNPNKVFTKEQIYRSIWEEEYFDDENIINVHISRLREKIEDDPSSPRYIKTLWGIGYKLGEF